MGTETISIEKISTGRFLSGTMMIAGTTIGAGMLGIPLVTAKAGFLPAVVITVLVWLFMLCTGFLFLEVTLNMPQGANILSMSKHFLGNKGKLAAGGMFAFLYYCLMIAYVAGGGLLFKEFSSIGLEWGLSSASCTLLFAAIFAFVVALGVKWIDRTNLILTSALVISYLLLIGTGSSAVESPRLLSSHWTAAFFATPVLFSAFGYHNVIPSLCAYLKKDRLALRFSLFVGTFIALVVYLLWQWLIIGSVPQQELLQTLSEGKPVTQALQTVTGRPWVYILGQYFAFFALVTSMLGVAFSMVDFLGEGLKISSEKGSRFLLTALTFVPPVACALYNPRVFDQALGIAGGFGEAFLNGLLPVALVWVGRYRLNSLSIRVFPGRKAALFFLMCFSLLVIVLEVACLLK